MRMLKDAPSQFAVGHFFSEYNYTAARQIYSLLLAVQPANECLCDPFQPLRQLASQSAGSAAVRRIKWIALLCSRKNIGHPADF